jgi:hypothetical protein
MLSMLYLLIQMYRKNSLQDIEYIERRHYYYSYQEDMRIEHYYLLDNNYLLYTVDMLTMKQH